VVVVVVGMGVFFFSTVSAYIYGNVAGVWRHFRHRVCCLRSFRVLAPIRIRFERRSRGDKDKVLLYVLDVGALGVDLRD
jgi:hypothetical protein